MRKTLIAFGSVVVVLALIAVTLPSLLDVNRYRGRIQAEIEQRLNRPVILGPMSLKLLPLRIRAQNLEISEGQQFPGGHPFAQAKELKVAVQLLPLLRGNVEIDSLELLQPQVELIRNAEGVWNFSSLGQHSTQQSAPSPGRETKGGQATVTDRPKPQPPAAEHIDAAHATQQRAFTLGKLEIEDGQVAVTDLLKPQPRAVYEHIDLTLKDYAPGKPFSIVAAARLPGPGTQEVRLEGDVGPVATDNLLATPFEGTLRLSDASISGLQRFFDAQALAGMEGILSGETKLKNAAGKLGAAGTMKIEQARVRKVDIGYPITANYSLIDDLANDLLRVDKGDVQLGKTPLSLTGTVHAQPIAAQIDLRVKASDISIVEVARLASALGVAFDPGTTVTGRLNADLQARGSALRPVWSGRLSGRDLAVSGKDLPQPVQAKAVDLTLTPTEVRSNDFELTTGKTTLASRFTLSQYASESPSIDATLRASNASLREALDIARAYGVTGLEGISGSGTLALDLRAAGPVKSVASAEVMRTLNGRLTGDLNNVRLPGIDVNYMLASVGGFLRPGEQKQPYTNISRVMGNVDIRNGTAQTNDLRATFEQGNLAAAGTLGLANQALNLHLIAVLSQEFSQQLGGTSIGGYMKTALADENGRLVFPLVVTGTFQNPRYAPDLEKIAQLKLRTLGTGQAGDLLGALLGKKGTGKGQNQTQPADAVKGLFDILSGREKKKPQP